MRRLTALLFWLAMMLAPAASAQGVSPAPQPASGPQKTARIEAELVPMSAWAAPGSTAIVAVRQVIEPGWHTYWRNPGDSGGATQLDWSLPTGVAAGGIVWPLPQRQPLLGLMNYGYVGEVFLPVPIEVPAGARPGTVLPLSVRALFLVCSAEMCVPDELILRLDLPVRDGAAPLDPRFGAEIQTVVETAPRPAGIAAHATLDGGTLRLTATGGPLAGGRIGQAYFFPYESGVIAHPAAQPGEAGADGLTLNLVAGGDLKASGLSKPLSGVLATDAGAWEITATPGAPLAGAGGGTALEPLAEAESQDGAGWGGFARTALFALLGGLILNLMPCVFPVLAMKAAGLAKAAHEPATARRDGFAFLAGVLTTFLVLAAVLLVLRAGGEAIGWGFQLQSPAVVAVLSLLMLAVGLNLSGVFDVGAGLQNAGSGPLSRLPGVAGAFVTGVLAVVVAAPCTAPFMAVALGAALVMPAPLALLVFLLLGLGLALPYLLVSLSPRLLARLPRPGVWMERLRGLLAFPMYGAALWLIWVFSRQTGAEALALLLGAALLAAMALWLLGRSQADRSAGASGRLQAVAAGLAMIAAVGLIVAAAGAPRPEPGVASASASALPSRPWSPEAVTAALAEGRPVLVDFTADWCVTCKINERTALASPRTAEAMSKANAVFLVGDWTRRDDAITRELTRHGRSGVPLYLLYLPGEPQPRVLPQLLTEGVVVDALTGLKSREAT